MQTPDVVGERMAGPGIRAWHLARQLAARVPTTLVAKGEGLPAPVAGLRHLPHGSTEARRAQREAAVLIGQPARGFLKLRREQKIVYDLFDPAVLELRELYGASPSIRQRVHLAAEWWRLAGALSTADLLIHAAPRQRAFYERLRSGDAPWVEVPFGIDPEEIPACPGPRGQVVLWGGGLWEWLDPQTAVDAIGLVNRRGTEAKLLFLGRNRPNRSHVERRRDDRLDALLAAGAPHVSANEDWVPYAERLSWLCASKAAIMLHRRTAEAEYSIRTRLFDAITAATPVIATEGGFAAGLVSEEGLGVVVPPGDPEKVADAISRLLTDDEMHLTCVKNLERIRPRYAWSQVTRPLVEAVLQWLT